MSKKWKYSSLSYVRFPYYFPYLVFFKQNTHDVSNKNQEVLPRSNKRKVN